jgi:hypothetical protein
VGDREYRHRVRDPQRGLIDRIPLWNTNSLVGLFRGWLLFNEQRGAGGAQLAKVLGGATAIATGAFVLADATSRPSISGQEGDAAAGIAAALGAGVLWGTMYIPCRKAYISGMNPPSFVTVFTFGESGPFSRLRLCSTEASRL